MQFATTSPSFVINGQAEQMDAKLHRLAKIDPIVLGLEITKVSFYTLPPASVRSCVMTTLCILKLTSFIYLFYALS